MELITVEVDISNGLNAVSIVGLGDRAVEESKDRVSAAVKNSGWTSPKQKNQKVVISLAPADVRKEGPAFDLAIAVGYLAAAGDLDCDLSGMVFLGELSLEGDVRRIAGVLPILCQAAARGVKEAFIPCENADEASLAADNISIYAVSSLSETVMHLRGLLRVVPLRPAPYPPTLADETGAGAYDMSMIRGNDGAKRALEIAASGAHNILMFGPPGTGKTMLAQSFQSILPPLTREEAIEVTGIHSAARSLGTELMSRPPFRSPHHTASYAAIVGGSAVPRPGEITLAHRGVLFMDEFPEFAREVIEALRQPLEERSITVSRARGSLTFPAQCILVASMNPCACGKARGNGCTCKDHERRLYRRKVSGPILDRMDIWLNVERIDYDKLSARKGGAEKSADIRERVEATRSIAAARFRRYGIAKRFNSEMSADDIEKIVVMSRQAREELRELAKRYELSGRAFHRVIKVAQTVADAARSPFIRVADILEALQYRQKMDDDMPNGRAMRLRRGFARLVSPDEDDCQWTDP
jgi:magnesium chelatase family protein